MLVSIHYGSIHVEYQLRSLDNPEKQIPALLNIYRITDFIQKVKKTAKMEKTNPKRNTYPSIIRVHLHPILHMILLHTQTSQILYNSLIKCVQQGPKFPPQFRSHLDTNTVQEDQLFDLPKRCLLRSFEFQSHFILLSFLLNTFNRKATYPTAAKKTKIKLSSIFLHQCFLFVKFLFMKSSV